LKAAVDKKKNSALATTVEDATPAPTVSSKKISKANV
jgi:hypothetical protein